MILSTTLKKTESCRGSYRAISVHLTCQVTNQHAGLIAEVQILKDEADEGRREMNERAAAVNDREILQVVVFILAWNSGKSSEMI